MKTLCPAFCLGVALLFVGCQSSPEDRIAKQQDVFAAMPAEVQDKIRKGEVAVGFTPEQVRLARGKPDNIAKRSTASGESEVWTYNKRGSGLGIGIGIGGGSGGMGGGVGVSSRGETEVDMRVVFERNIVTAVERNQR
ncbi:MAG: hypothetical protein SFV32_05700 [Opitutaceae bacterium]|nr:hypothetical protein [Opitutaceae bacterium]